MPTTVLNISIIKHQIRQLQQINIANKESMTQNLKIENRLKILTIKSNSLSFQSQRIKFLRDLKPHLYTKRKNLTIKRSKFKLQMKLIQIKMNNKQSQEKFLNSKTN